MGMAAVGFEVINRKDAKAAGLKRFYTGKPCKHGHIDERYTIAGSCCTCCADNMRSTYNADVDAAQERNRERSARYRANDPERYAKNLASANERRNAKRSRLPLEVAREQDRIRYLRWPATFKANARNRKARVREAEGRHSSDDIAALYKRQKGKCVYCKASIKNERHVDHIMPIALGGSNWPDNLQLLCPPCNLHKRAMHPTNFAQRIGMLL